jgi:hypothetical protein
MSDCLSQAVLSYSDGQLFQDAVRGRGIWDGKKERNRCGTDWHCWKIVGEFLSLRSYAKHLVQLRNTA